ncbi:MAG: extracellular solute-binding protein, partial [Blautia sp.]|nr:extracellular solute-binding protein [Blautia sp.]
IFEQYGLDYKSVKTWDDYTALGEQLKEASNGEVFLTSVDTGGVDWMWIAMAEYGEDWTGGPGGEPNVELDSVKKMMAMQKQWLDDGIAMISTDGHVDLEAGFKNVSEGKIASFPKAMWYMSRFTNYMPEMEGKYDITTIPVFEEGQKCSVGIGGTGTVVTSQCADPALAAEFLAWAKLSEEGESYIWSVLGFDVCNASLWFDEEFAFDESNMYNTFFRCKPYEVLQDLAEQDAIGTIYTTTVSPTLNDYMCTTTLNEVFEDGMDIDEALAEAQEYLEMELM